MIGLRAPLEGRIPESAGASALPSSFGGTVGCGVRAGLGGGVEPYWASAGAALADSKTINRADVGFMVWSLKDGSRKVRCRLNPAPAQRQGRCGDHALGLMGVFSRARARARGGVWPGLPLGSGNSAKVSPRLFAQPMETGILLGHRTA